MQKLIRSALVLCSLPAFYSGCAVDTSPSEQAEGESGSLQQEQQAPGALVDVKMTSRVAVVIDEIAPGERARLAAFYLAKPSSFWVERAKRQIRHTSYRLTYRDAYYDPSEHRRMLELPPEEVWNITLSGKAKRVTTGDGHDAIEVGYVLASTIVTDTASPGAADPNLKHTGGVWNEPFNLPLDPEFLFQRTGYACADEDGYPLGTAEAENMAYVFDQECGVETAATASCHLSQLPKESCLDALAAHVGRVDTNLRLERVSYSAARANSVRVGTFTQNAAPDLAVVSENLGNNWVEYRYIPPDSCAITEQCVGGSGWRRLLLFDASIKNSGAAALSVGSTDPSSPAAQHNVFEFSACHQHFHFSHYGDFSYGDAPGDKRAFCVESTDRYYNNESTPLVHDFNCENQGVAAGWGDTYIAGVECNWIDVTDVAIPSAGLTQNLKFVLNPDNFLCEGQPVLDARGQPVYETTSFVTETGAPVGRPVCDFATGYKTNNTGTHAVQLPPEGSIVTASCTRDQAGPLRDCGFKKQQQDLACKPGSAARLSCRVEGAGRPQAVRVCDNSKQLGGIACMYADALANDTVPADDDTTLSFRCPAARGTGEPGGTYSIYVAPLSPNDPVAKVKCTLR